MRIYNTPAMTQVAILGAGEIGGAVASVLARGSRVDEIRLIDENERVARGTALDIQQTAPFSGSDARVAAFGDIGAAAGATVIVIADPAGSSAGWQGAAARSLVARVGRMGLLQNAILICAGCGHLDLMGFALDELHLRRSRIIGSAPEALASGLRALVALEAGAAARDVALTVLGRPPDRALVAWTAGSIAGTSIFALLSPSQIHKLQRQLPALWPVGPGALALAAARMCEAVAQGSRQLFSCFVSRDRDNGTSAPLSAWPAVLGPGGVERVAEPLLSAHERLLMDNTLEDVGGKRLTPDQTSDT